MRNTTNHSWQLMEYGETIDVEKLNTIFEDIDDKIYQENFYTVGVDSDNLILTKTENTKGRSSYFIGMLVCFIATYNNTGTMTVNVDNLGVVSITDSSTPGIIKAGRPYILIYDGTEFKILNKLKTSDSIILDDSNVLATSKAVKLAKEDAKAYSDQLVVDLLNGSPAALDTLYELSAALGNDPDFATTMTDLIGTKANKSGDTFSGNISVPSITIGGYTVTVESV